METNNNFDPRGPWECARRTELVRYANEKGHPEINEQLPKIEIVKKLKALGIPPPNVPQRSLVPVGGSYDPRSGDTNPVSHKNGSAAQPKEETTIDADEIFDLERQQKKPIEKMGWHELRAEVKARGMKLDRKWRVEDLKAVLNGKNTP